jgi:hypothetical protein
VADAAAERHQSANHAAQQRRAASRQPPVVGQRFGEAHRYAGANDEIADAFRASTDGPDCPISRAYGREEFAALARGAGFALESFGVAVSAFEMSLLPKRFEAIMDARLRPESRDFLASLTFDSQGLPLSDGVHAGVDGCYRFRAV